MARRSFEGQTVLVTGGAGGLGAALARRFGRSGARVGLLDLRAEPLDRQVEALRSRGVEAASAVGDITDESAVGKAVEALEKELGPTSVLVNNAGITHRQPFGADQVSFLRKVTEVNFLGAVHCTAAVFDQVVSQRGMFVAISSVAGFAPLVDRTAYSASKHALEGFFATLRGELRGTGVDVMVVSPSFIQTGIRDEQENAEEWPVAGGMDTPDAVAEKIFRGAERRRRHLRVGRIAHLSFWLQRWSPRLYEMLMLRSMR